MSQRENLEPDRKLKQFNIPSNTEKMVIKLDIFYKPQSNKNKLISASTKMQKAFVFLPKPLKLYKNS